MSSVSRQLWLIVVPNGDVIDMNVISEAVPKSKTKISTRNIPFLYYPCFELRPFDCQADVLTIALCRYL